MKKHIFIVGAAKCGTTKLSKFLSKSEKVSSVLIKEPNYFCPDFRDAIIDSNMNSIDLVDSYEKISSGHSHAAFVKGEEVYKNIFSDGSINIDSSTNYLISEDAPYLIKNYDENSKIIIMIRDPIRRIQSHYVMDHKIGIALEGLSEELYKEIYLQPVVDWSKSPCYLRRSTYSNDIKRYYDVFGEDNVLVVVFEDLFNRNNSEEISRILSFCNIEDIPWDYRKENSAQSVRYIFLNKILFKFGIKRLVRNLMPEIIKGYLRRFMYKELSDSSNSFPVDLIRYFENDMKELNSMGISIGKWSNNEKY